MSTDRDGSVGISMPPLGAIMAGAKKHQRMARMNATKKCSEASESSECDASDSSDSSVGEAGDSASSESGDGDATLAPDQVRKRTYAVVRSLSDESACRGTAKARHKQRGRHKKACAGACSRPTAVGVDQGEEDSVAGVEGETTISAPSPPRFLPKRRAHRKNPRSDMEEIAKAAKAKGINTQLPAFPFPPAKTFAEFDDNLSSYCFANKTMLTTRDSNSREARNEILTDRFEKSKKKTAELHLIPAELLYYQRVYLCKHAEYSKSKSVSAGKPGEKPKRYQASTLFTECTGRITARAVRGADGKWLVHAVDENVFHNHSCNKHVYRSYKTDSMIDDQILFERVRAQFSARGDSRAMRDQLSAAGEAFTASQFSNLKHYRFGGGDAQENMERLLGHLESTTDARCLLIHDQENTVTGVLFQTGIQREYVKRFADNLVLDWTHQTNNLGLHLGSLMATSVTGKGVPVYNFLCLSQGVDTMTSVLRLFLDGSPGLGDLLESVVIDKDYKEWKALNMVFDGATVVLCQFHVLKWFKTVVADARYNIGKAARPKVLKLVRRMLYAETEDSFRAVKGKLRDLLSDDEGHPAFHKYMDARWYAIEHMWANYKRGRVFTAGNTTSNRLESHWNQLKALLRKFKRIDKCVEAVIMRECTIVRREFDELSRACTRTPLLRGDDNFIRPLLRDLCTSRMELVREQWVKYQAHMARSTAAYYTRNSTGSLHSIGVHSQSDMKFVVRLDDTAPWECSCRFASSHRLPCRHQFFAAQQILRREVFPVEAVSNRWRVSANADLVRLLAEASEELAPIRLTLPEWKATGTSTLATARVTLPRPFKKVRIVSVPRRKVGGYVVLEATEKRNLVEAQCAAVVSRMMRLGTERFWDAATLLEDAVTAFLAQLDISDGACSGVVQSSRQRDDGGSATGLPALPGIEPTDDEASGPMDGSLVADEAEYGVVADEAEYGVVADEAEYSNVAYDVDMSDDDDEEDEGEGEVENVQHNVPPVEIHVQPVVPSRPDGDGDGDIEMNLWGNQTELESFVEPVAPAFTPVAFPFTSPIRFEDVRYPSQLNESAVHTVFSPPPVLSPLYQDGVRFLVGSSQTSGGMSPEATQWPWRDSLWGSDDLSSTPSLHYMVADTDPGSVAAESAPDVQPPAPTQSKKREPASDVQPPAPTQSKKRESAQDESDDALGPRVKKIRRGIFAEFSLPKHTPGAPRNSKQLAKAKRLVVALPSPACPVPVSQFVAGVRHSNLSAVTELVVQYPCREDVNISTRNVSITSTIPTSTVVTPAWTLPSKATQTILAAFRTRRTEDGRGNEGPAFDGSEPQYIATVDGLDEAITEESVFLFTELHGVRGYVTRYKTDMDWMGTKSNWATLIKSPRQIGFLDETQTYDHGTREHHDTPVARLLEDTKMGVCSLTLATTLSVGSVGIGAMEVLGRLSGSTWLNDSIVFFSLCVMAARHNDVTVVDPLRREGLSLERLRDQRVVIFPINISDTHWCAIYVLPNWNGKHNVFSYDPQCKPDIWGAAVESAWTDWASPLLDKWARRDALREVGVCDVTDDASLLPGFGPVQHTAVMQPKQTDSNNCGVFVLGVASTYIEDNYELQDMETLTPTNLKLMRLRILHLVVSTTSRSWDAAEKAAGDEAVALFRTYAAPPIKQGRPRRTAKAT